MKLELINADPSKAAITLTEFPVIVGLDPGADVCLDDSAIGHYQCMIDHSDGTLMVWDLGTKLGTWVNGVRVAKKSPLASGDELMIGRSHFTVEYDDGQPQSHRAGHALPEARRKHHPAPHRRQPAVPA